MSGPPSARPAARSACPGGHCGAGSGVPGKRLMRTPPPQAPEVSAFIWMCILFLLRRRSLAHPPPVAGRLAAHSAWGHPVERCPPLGGGMPSVRGVRGSECVAAGRGVPSVSSLTGRAPRMKGVRVSGGRGGEKGGGRTNSPRGLEGRPGQRQTPGCLGGRKRGDYQGRARGWFCGFCRPW